MGLDYTNHHLEKKEKKVPLKIKRANKNKDLATKKTGGRFEGHKKTRSGKKSHIIKTKQKRDGNALNSVLKYLGALGQMPKFGTTEGPLSEQNTLQFRLANFQIKQTRLLLGRFFFIKVVDFFGGWSRYDFYLTVR